MFLNIFTFCYIINDNVVTHSLLFNKKAVLISFFPKTLLNFVQYFISELLKETPGELHI